jgi:hypothetical protein
MITFNSVLETTIQWVESLTVWDRKYPVTFVSNGGTEVDTQYILFNGLVSEPADPFKINYLLEGWYTDANLTTQWDFTTDVIQEKTTLYAKYESALVQQFNGVVSGNELIDEINGYNLDIIGKDFTTDYIPYKTAALIAQKVENIDFIPNPNNFWFTSGVPNQIPVTAFIENIDNQIFCRFQAQEVDGDGVETTESGIVEIATYASELTGETLTQTDEYYQTPAYTGYWISKTGNDSTGTGSLLNTWLTWVKAIATILTGGKAAAKSGTYVENYDATYGIRIGKDCELSGKGNVTIQAGATKRVSSVVIAGNQVKLNNLTLDGQGQNVRANSVETCPLDLTYNRCNFKNSHVTGSMIRDDSNRRTGAVISLKDSLILTTGTYGYRGQANNLVIDSNYFKGTWTAAVYFEGIAGTGVASLIIKNNKFDLTGATIAIQIGFAVASLSVKGNKIVTGSTNGGQVVSLNSSYDGTLEVLGNDITINAPNTSVNNGARLRNSKIKNNIITAISTVGCISISNDDLVEIDGNTLTSNTSNILITATSRKITSFSITNNVITNTSQSNPGIQLGTDNSTSGQDNLEGMVISGNKITADITKIDTNSVHAVAIFMNKNVKVSYYNVSYASIGVVFKSQGNTNTGAYCQYSVFKNCAYNLFSKSQSGVKYINNTIYNDHLFSTWMGVELMKNDVGSTVGSENTYLRNNVIANYCPTSNTSHYLLYVDSFSQAGFDSDYNIFYATHPDNIRFQWGGTIVTSLAAWQALTGNDLNSIVLNPQLDADLIPAIALNYGTDLGASFNTGLDTSTDWPTIVTKQQGAQWQCGAFII